MEQDLSCGVCSEVYSEGERDPVLLPHCGHAFCRPCLLSLERKGALECPFCRRTHDSVPVLQLPVVFALLGLARHFKRSKFGACAVHGSLLEFWCRRCRSSLCGHCLFGEHDQRHVVSMDVVIKEKKAEVQETGQRKLKAIGDKKTQITEKLNEGLLNLATLCREAETLSTSVRETKRAMDDARGALDVASLLECLQCMERRPETEVRELCQHPELPIDEKRTPVRGKSLIRMAGVRRRYRQSRSFSLDYQSDQTGHEDLRLRFSAFGSSAASGTLSGTLSPRANETLVPDAFGDSADASTDVSEARNEALEIPADAEASTPANDEKEEAADSAPSTSTGETEAKSRAWLLRCFVRSKDGRLGKMRAEEGRLHVYALASSQEESHLTMQLSVVECLLPESAEVFLDLSARGRHLGRVYVRLWGHLRRAQHFLALCLGTFGPSFRGSKVRKVESPGRAGECLRVSHYLTAEGDASAQGLMEGLEWGGEHSLPKKAGLVVAASGGKAEYDGCFDICTRDNPAKRFSCPFGEVSGGGDGKDGMDVVRRAARFHPVSEVAIAAVGVVLDPRR